MGRILERRRGGEEIILLAKSKSISHYSFVSFLLRRRRRRSNSEYQFSWSNISLAAHSAPQPSGQPACMGELWLAPCPFPGIRPLQGAPKAVSYLRWINQTSVLLIEVSEFTFKSCAYLRCIVLTLDAPKTFGHHVESGRKTVTWTD